MPTCSPPRCHDGRHPGPVAWGLPTPAPVLDDALPPFPGFRPEAFQFLRDLKANTDREWFKPRKATYEDELLWPMRCLIADLGRELPPRGLPIVGAPDKAVFRIYRDTRFSKNKDPYKTHVGAYLTRSGNRDEDGGVYVHVGPDSRFVGGGFWSPDPALLRRWRAQMLDAPGVFLDVVEALRAEGLEVEMQDALKRMPRGFEHLAEHPIAPFVKGRGLFATRPYTEAQAASPDFAHWAADAALAIRPFLEWGWALADGQG